MLTYEAERAGGVVAKIDLLAGLLVLLIEAGEDAGGGCIAAPAAPTLPAMSTRREHQRSVSAHRRGRPPGVQRDARARTSSPNRGVRGRTATSDTMSR